MAAQLQPTSSVSNLQLTSTDIRSTKIPHHKPRSQRIKEENIQPCQIVSPIELQCSFLASLGGSYFLLECAFLKSINTVYQQ